MLTTLIAPGVVSAQSWNAWTGAQRGDKGGQVLAFLPNELWIHAGDTVTWQIDSDEPHTVTFLQPGGTRPTFRAGCPGTTPDRSLFNGSACVNSGTLSSGQTYTVSFPAPGNFKLVCLVHANMTGTIHVLDLRQCFLMTKLSTMRRRRIGGANCSIRQRRFCIRVVTIRQHRSAIRFRTAAIGRQTPPGPPPQPKMK